MDGLDPIIRLTKDLKDASKLLGQRDARYLVDLYYQIQENRIRASGQVRATINEVAEQVEPNALIRWVADNFRTIENDIKRALGPYVMSKRVGRWAMSQRGIGPVIGAGLLAHIDITKSPHVSSLWRFAGQDPTSVWEKGQVRPWNARLKNLCWKVGQSMIKQQGRESLYADLFRQRKDLEVERNEKLLFKDQAAEGLKRVGKGTEAYTWYKKGMLPPGRLNLRAMRKSTKMFLSHYWAVAYECHYDKKAENPWIIAHGGHAEASLVSPPGWPID